MTYRGASTEVRCEGPASKECIQRAVTIYLLLGWLSDLRPESRRRSVAHRCLTASYNGRSLGTVFDQNTRPGHRWFGTNSPNIVTTARLSHVTGRVLVACRPCLTDPLPTLAKEVFIQSVPHPRQLEVHTNPKCLLLRQRHQLRSSCSPSIAVSTRSSRYSSG